MDIELQRSLTPEIQAGDSATTPASITERQGANNLDLLMHVELAVTLRFGQREMLLQDILDLQSGSVIELDREIQEPVDLVLDGRIIARGQVVVVDGNYGLRVSEVGPALVVPRS
jgi:flagellar motor switch protein FliN/FliY